MLVSIPLDDGNTYRDLVVGTHGDASHTGPEEAQEDAVHQLRAGEAQVNRASVRLVDALTLKDVVPVRKKRAWSASIQGDRARRTVYTGRASSARTTTRIHWRPQFKHTSCTGKGPWRWSQ